jgi:hypothetical protein
MTGRLKKILLLVFAAGLLAGVSRVQTLLNRERDELGLTRTEALENAPPVLAFTTVALGGFRGLIANALWIRATGLQDEDKYFEMAQLADWITKLEPHFVQVWVVQAWNMAYNISVRFKDFSDRWRWVEGGIELLRDEGIRYNPNEPLIYRELGWFFQHKMGGYSDDAHLYYKQEWANEMARVFGKAKPNFDELINPQTDDARERAKLLREKYKMDPKVMKQIDERYGPLEWRLPEAHAVYWAALGLEKATQNLTKINQGELIQLRRVIYQSMNLSFQRGQLVVNPFAKVFEFSPNLDIIPKVNFAYEEAMQQDAENRDYISKAHRNFLCDAVYFLYLHNRVAESARWYRYLGEEYPEKNLIEGATNSLPRQISLDEYAVARVQGDVNETAHDRTKSVIEGLLASSYRSLALGEESRAAGFRLLAEKVRTNYQGKIKGREAISMAPLGEIEREVLGQLLDPESGLSPEVKAVLRTKLGLPAETAPAASPANTPSATTNTPPAAATGK